MFGHFVKMFHLFDRASRLGLLALLLPILALSVLEMVGVGIMLPLLQMLTNPDSIDRMPLVADLRDGVFGGEHARLIVAASIAVTVFFLVKNTAFVACNYIQHRFVARHLARFMARVLEYYLSRPFPYYLEHNTAEIHRNLMRSTNNVFNNGVMAFLQIVTELLVTLAVLVMLLLIDPLPILVVGAVLAVVVVVMHGAMGGRMSRWGHQHHALERDIIQWINQAFGSIKETKVLQRESFFLGRFRAMTETWTRINSFALTFSSVPRAFFECVMVGVLFGLVAVFVSLGRSPEDFLPVLGVYGAAGLRLLPSVNRIVLAASQIKLAASSIDALYADLAGQPLPSLTTESKRLPFRSAIAFEDVTFGYDRSGPPTISNINFTVRHGGSIALIGASGAGKTTIVDILLGLHQPWNGRVTIDGTQLSGNERQWQRCVGYVPQQVYLADDTLTNNIAFGVPPDEIDHARLKAVVEMARLTELVAMLPDGLETMVGENAVRISGGQRQRLGIARALYHDPDVLVMDEATSALDAVTENEVADEIDLLRGKKTIVIIAHRLATVRRCDQLLYLDGGKVEGAGTYDELYRHNAAFRRMVALMENDEEAIGEPAVK